MKTISVDFEVEQGVKIPATFKPLRNKLICTVTTDNGKLLTMEATISPPNKSRKLWHAKCMGWETGSERKYDGALALFRTVISFVNSVIEANKCPMYNDGSGEYPLHCQFLPEHPEIFGSCKLPLKQGEGDK